MIAGSRVADQTSDRDADLPLVGAGHSPEHILEPPGFLAHPHHVDGQPGNGACAWAMARRPFPPLHAVGTAATAFPITRLVILSPATASAPMSGTPLLERPERPDGDARSRS